MQNVSGVQSERDYTRKRKEQARHVNNLKKTNDFVSEDSHRDLFLSRSSLRTYYHRRQSLKKKDKRSSISHRHSTLQQSPAFTHKHLSYDFNHINVGQEFDLDFNI